MSSQPLVTSTKDYNFYDFDQHERCLISPASGCHAKCTYCYNRTAPIIYSNPETIVKAVTSDPRYQRGKTIISLGCYTECLAPHILQHTLEIIDFFLKKGHRVSIATKMASTVLLHQGFSKNFYVFISCPTFSHSEKYEPSGVAGPRERLSSIPELQQEGITPVLYIKPFLPETPEDKDIFIDICSSHNISAVIGRYLSQNGGGERVSLINNVLNEELSEKYDTFYAEMSTSNRVFHNSVDILREN